MNKSWIVFSGICWGLGTSAQVDSLALRYASTITQKDLRAHLSVIAGDDYEGRETGQAGQRKASQYIREQFAQFGIGPVPNAEARGLVNGYEQKFALEVSRPGGLAIEVNGVKKAFGADYFYFSDKLHQDLAVQQVVFAGHGITDQEHNDYEGVDQKNAVVLVLEGTNSKEPPTDEGFFNQLRQKARAAETAGARVLLIASARVPELIRGNGAFPARWSNEARR